MSAEAFVSLLARCQRREMWGLRNQAHNHDVRIRIAPNSELWRLKMNRTVVSGIAAFALMIGAGLAMTDTTAEAGRCGGGLLSRLQAKTCGGNLLDNIELPSLGDRGCSGGLLSKLKALHAADCCAPEEEVVEEVVEEEAEPCAEECCEKPCLLERLMSKLRFRKACCEEECESVEEAASSSDSAEEAAPAADAKADA